MDYRIDLKVAKIQFDNEVKNGPSGYGIFSLLYNGKLGEDHYLSAKLFKNIISKNLRINADYLIN